LDRQKKQTDCAFKQLATGGTKGAVGLFTKSIETDYRDMPMCDQSKIKTMLVLMKQGKEVEKEKSILRIWDLELDRVIFLNNNVG
jgi:hypothetical protein